MIVQTKFKLEEDGWEFVRSYSSRGMMIRQDGTDELYAEAVDPVFMNRTYTETDIPIPEEEENREDNVENEE